MLVNINLEKNIGKKQLNLVKCQLILNRYLTNACMGWVLTDQ